MSIGLTVPVTNLPLALGAQVSVGDKIVIPGPTNVAANVSAICLPVITNCAFEKNDPIHNAMHMNRCFEYLFISLQTAVYIITPFLFRKHVLK